MKNWVLYIFCFLCCTSIFGQVTVTTELSPPPYTAGVPILVTIKVDHPSNVRLGEVSVDQFSEDFTITRNPSNFDISQNRNITTKKKDIIVVPKFHGDLLFPPVLVQYFEQGQESGAVSKVKKISVAPGSKGEQKKEYPMPITDETIKAMNDMLSSGIPTAAPQGQQQSQQQGGMQGAQPGIQPGMSPAMGSDPIANPYGEIKDLKPIIEEPLKFQDFLPYLIAILVLVALISAIFYFLNKRKQPEPPPKPEVWIPAHNTALADLTTLKNKQLWQNGAVKEYQTELTDIIRKYLENRFEINAMEMTSDDIVYHLKKKTSVAATQQGKLKDILQIADLVKFAKANPPVNINEQFWNDAENFVQATKTDEIPAAFTAKQEAIQAEYQAKISGVPVSDIVGATTATATVAATTISTAQGNNVLASRTKRLGAMLIDSICFSILYAAIFLFISFGLGIDSNSPTVAILAYVFIFSLIFLIYWFIFGFLNSKHRQSLGKKLLGIVVTDKEGGPLSLSQASIRSLIYFVESLFVLPLLWIFFDKEKQTLHDKAVKSIVINKNYKKEANLLDV